MYLLLFIVKVMIELDEIFFYFYELLSSQSGYTYQVHMELQRISLYLREIIIKININKNKIMQKKGSSVCIYIYITNCRQYCFGLLDLISAVLILGWR